MSIRAKLLEIKNDDNSMSYSLGIIDGDNNVLASSKTTKTNTEELNVEYDGLSYKYDGYDIWLHFDSVINKFEK